MEKYEVVYIIALAVLGVIAFTFGFVPAYAAPVSIAEQISYNDYGLYYKVSHDAEHIGISVEDNGANEFAVEHFVENALNVVWRYANYEDPSFNGYIRIAGFEQYHGQVDEVFWLENSAIKARLMSQSDWVANGMAYYYDAHNAFPSGDAEAYTYTNEVYIEYPNDDYYISQTSATGNGQILVTTQADAADWNTPI